MTTAVKSVTRVQQGVDLDMANPTGTKQSPIVEALSSKCTGDSMVRLAKFAGLEYIKKYNLLLRGSQQVVLRDVFRFYGVLGTTIRCPHCLESIGIDVVLIHLQNNFRGKGHRFTNKQVVQFFIDEETGKNADIIWKKNNSH